MPIVCLSCGWLLGVLVGLNYAVHPAWGLAAAGLLPLFFLKRQRRQILIVAGLSFAVFFVAALHANSSRPMHAGGALALENDSGKIKLQGMVATEPEAAGETLRIRFSARSIEQEGAWRSTSGMALLIVSRYPEYRYGDILTVDGRLEGRPRSFDTEDQSKYWDYLANSDIYSLMFYPKIELTARGNGSPGIEWLYSVRNALTDSLEKVLPEPQAALAQGIALGVRTNIPSSLKNDFVSTGTAHLLAVSGINLTIIAGMLLFVTLRLFGRKGHVHIWSTLTIVWAYALFTGLQPPVARAAIMATVFLGADLFGRQRRAMIALIVAAAVMVGISPDVLYDPSFQLSFAAMAGLVIVFPVLEEASRTQIDRLALNEKMRSVAAYLATGFGVSLAAVITTWPLTAHYFGVISWVGPMATFLAAPAVPPIMVAGIFAAALGVVFLPLAQVAAWLAWLPLSYLGLVVRSFDAVSGANVHPTSLPTWMVLLYLGALAMVVLAYRRRQRLAATVSNLAAAISKLPLKWAVPPLAVTAVLVWAIFITLPDNRMHVNFLDVGQGDAILIVKGNRQVLIDGGPDPQPLLLSLGKKMPFWDRNIDMVVLTHPDADHLGGLIEVLKRYKVGQVLTGNTTSDSPLFREWQSAIAVRDIEITAAAAGQRISLGPDVSMSVLNPGPEMPKENVDDSNSQSVVLRVSMGETSFLLTGDLPAEVETALTAERAHLRSTVLKVAHHGSDTSTADAFLGAVDPRIAVISVGQDNAYGHPSPTVIERLSERLGAQSIFRTDQQGTIEFITNGERLWVRTER